MRDFDINLVIENMKRQKEIYASEKDFQFQLAWNIQKEYENDNVSVILEYSPCKENIHIDILVTQGENWYPIEIKYKTKKIEDEQIKVKLKDQGAQDQGRCNFLWDIHRLEEFKEKNKNIKKGYAIFLTNDMSYKNGENKKRQTVDDMFRLFQKRKIKKKEKLFWKEGTSKGTIGSCPKEIQFNQEIIIDWKSFYTIDYKDHNKFEYLLIEVQ